MLTGRTMSFDCPPDVRQEIDIDIDIELSDEEYYSLKEKMQTYTELNAKIREK